jgi:hypothetical protein
MSQSPGRWWVVLAAAALLAYLAVVIVAIIAVWSNTSADFRDLARSAAWFIGLFFAAPTVALASLILTRWHPRPVAAVAIGWLVVNVVLWLSVAPIVALWATLSAGVIGLALLCERQSRNAHDPPKV